MRKRIGLAVLAVLAMTVAACGSPNAAGGSAESVAPVDRAATVRVAWAVAPNNLDPHLSVGPNLEVPMHNLSYDRLVQVTRDTLEEPAQIAPMAATSWEYSPDFLTLMFDLREDVRFHDGTLLDANAVKFSLERSKTLPGSTGARQLEPVRAVRVVDPTTVALDLNRPAAELLFFLAQPAAGALVNPASATSGADLKKQPDGSGPYRLTELLPGDRATFTRSEGYWDPDAQQAGAVELIGIVDSNARHNALRSGQVDAITSSLDQSAQIATFEQDDAFSVVRSGPEGVLAALINTGRAPLDDVRVRRALNLAIDRDAINEQLLGGACAPASQPFSATDPAHSTAVQDYGYDPAEARRLLAEAGHPDGFAMNMLVIAGLSPYAQIASIMQAELAEIGVRVEINAVDIPTIPRIWSAGEADIYMHIHRIAQEPAATFLEEFQPPRRQGPAPAGYDAALAELVDAGADPAAHAAAAQRASQFVSEQALDVFVCSVPAVYLTSKDVVGLDANRSGYSGIFDLRGVGKRAAG